MAAGRADARNLEKRSGVSAVRFLRGLTVAGQKGGSGIAAQGVTNV